MSARLLRARCASRCRMREAFAEIYMMVWPFSKQRMASVCRSRRRATHQATQSLGCARRRHLNQVRAIESKRGAVARDGAAHLGPGALECLRPVSQPVPRRPAAPPLAASIAGREHPPPSATVADGGFDVRVAWMRPWPTPAKESAGALMRATLPREGRHISWQTVPCLGTKVASSKPLIRMGEMDQTAGRRRRHGPRAALIL